VLNWGGFGTHSFRIGDGDRLFHVKLTTDQVDLRRWMNVQCQAFDGMTSAPCHWDLWPNNVMTEKTGGWWVLDWDSLATGDEAEDYATLVWPFFVSGKENWRTIFEAKADRSFVERVDLHLRAITLDYAIDVLADWAECDVPEWREQVRTRKEAEHSQYLDWYRSRWD
jgi:thiamine kinase-like enzyme